MLALCINRKMLFYSLANKTPFLKIESTVKNEEASNQGSASAKIDVVFARVKIKNAVKTSN